MPPRNSAGKHSTTGGPAEAKEPDLRAFQDQQRALQNYENRCEEGQEAEALRLVHLSEALSQASLRRRQAMGELLSEDDVSSVATIQTSSAILVASEISVASEFIP